MTWSRNLKLTFGIESPCLDCPDRAPACWDQCDTYKDYKSKVDEIKGRLRAEKTEEYRLHPGIKVSKGNWRRS